MNPFQEPKAMKQPPPRCPSCEKKDRELEHAYDEVLRYAFTLKLQQEVQRKHVKRERRIHRLMSEIIAWGAKPLSQ